MPTQPNINPVDVLLIYPSYGWHLSSPPLGLGYIASVLIEAGYTTDILDLSVLKLSDNHLKELIAKYSPKIVGISFMTSQSCEVVSIARITKSINQMTPVIVGGPHATEKPHDMLKNREIDFVVLGEGEFTARDLVSTLMGGQCRFEDIRGLAYKNGGQILVNQRRELISNLDMLPLPAWHLLRPENYTNSPARGDSEKGLFNLLSSRGCPYHCIFCNSHSIFGRRFRARSPAHIISEIKFLVDHFNAARFEFVDDTFTIDGERVLEFCALIKKEGLKIGWICNARVDRVSLPLLNEMKQAGCTAIRYGIESASQDQLDLLKKGISLRQIEDALSWTRKGGITIHAHFLTGIPQEDCRMARKNVRFVQRLDIDYPSVAILTPFPGTEIYSLANTQGWMRAKEWSEFITTPHFVSRFKPVMVTDTMKQNDILKSYYYLNSRFLWRKYRTKYGKLFFLNPHFYKDKIFAINSPRQFAVKLRTLWHLVVAA